MTSSNMNVPVVDSNFNWKWWLTDLPEETSGTVFSCFSCGGGSSMGYKKAGFKVLGNVEIDPVMNQIYKQNLHPEYSFLMDLRAFNKIPNEKLPEELFHLDILDGSPPCSTFSVVGDREKAWGKKKKFREGQAEQTLDDLFFVFLDTVEKLQPRVAVAENVEGLLKGNARGYVHEIVKRFKELGYNVQLFLLDAASMDVPQRRRRVFFIANKEGFKPLKLEFNSKPIPFGDVRSEKGQGWKSGSKMAEIVKYIRLIRYCDRKSMSEEDIRNVASFPQDYDFTGSTAAYVCGMSVPPNMMANIASEIKKQWSL